MKDDTRMRFLMATALVLAIAAMLAGPAGARPIDTDGTELSSSQQQVLRPDDKAGALGVGAIAEPQTVIPYLSQGQGVDASQYGGVQNARSNSGWYTGLEYADLPQTGNQTAPPQSSDDPVWREPSVFGAALAALLLAAMTLMAVRKRHGGKVAM